MDGSPRPVEQIGYCRWRRILLRAVVLEFLENGGKIRVNPFFRPENADLLGKVHLRCRLSVRPARLAHIGRPLHAPPSYLYADYFTVQTPFILLVQPSFARRTCPRSPQVLFI